VKLPWTVNILFKKKKKGRRIIGLFSGDYQWEVGGHKERVNEDKYSGCILCSYMKTEEGNLLKLFWGE
jgi:hypothetical protein